MLDMIGLTDEVLPLLVEYNPMITVEILMIILKNKNNETIEKYLRQITNINVTLQSLEGKIERKNNFKIVFIFSREPFGDTSGVAIWFYTILHH